MVRRWNEKRDSLITDAVLGDGRTCEDVGREFGLSPQRICTIVQKQYRWYFVARSMGTTYDDGWKLPVVPMKSMRRRYNL